MENINEFKEIVSKEYYLNLARNNKNVKAFLDLIGFTEGTDKIAVSKGKTAYNIMYSGQICELKEHPDRVIKAGNYSSSAAGRYQFMAYIWFSYRKQPGGKIGGLGLKDILKLKDFSKDSQDAAAVYLIGKGQANALKQLIEGKFDEVLDKCARVWASMPVVYAVPKHPKNQSFYGQGGYKIDVCKSKYQLFGGTFFFQPVQTLTSGNLVQNFITGFLSLFVS